jgi:hypothetical protein
MGFESLGAQVQPRSDGHVGASLRHPAGLRPALDELDEEYAVTVQAAPGRRYPDTIESSVYLLG